MLVEWKKSLLCLFHSILFAQTMKRDDERQSERGFEHAGLSWLLKEKKRKKISANFSLHLKGFFCVAENEARKYRRKNAEEECWCSAQNESKNCFYAEKLFSLLEKGAFVLLSSTATRSHQHRVTLKSLTPIELHRFANHISYSIWKSDKKIGSLKCDSAQVPLRTHAAPATPTQSTTSPLPAAPLKNINFLFSSGGDVFLTIIQFFAGQKGWKMGKFW